MIEVKQDRRASAPVGRRDPVSVAPIHEAREPALPLNRFDGLREVETRVIDDVPARALGGRAGDETGIDEGDSDIADVPRAAKMRNPGGGRLVDPVDDADRLSRGHGRHGFPSTY